MPVDGATARRPGDSEPMLFNRAADPAQSRNLWNDEPGQRQRMLDLMARLMTESGAPSELYDRLGLVRPAA
jgi:hypothetical protein